MTEEYVPKTVKQRMADLLTWTGTEATLTSAPGYWHVVHGNERVTLTCTWRRGSRGKLSYSTTLSVDGKPVGLVENCEQYARLLSDPDNDKPKRRTDCELPPVYPLADGEEIPAEIAKEVAGIWKLDDVASVTVGHCSMAQRKRFEAWTWDLNEDDDVPNPDSFVIETVKGSGNRIQLHYHPAPGFADRYIPTGMSGVDSKNRDLMETGKSFAELLDGLLGIKMPKQSGVNAGPVRPKGDSRGEASNAVTVRRATVIRN